MQPITVLVAGVNAAFRQRIVDFLASERDIQVVGEAEDGVEAVLKGQELRPDVFVMDVMMAGISGLEATTHIKALLPESAVVLLSRFDIQEYRDAARARGASAYVTNQSLLEELLPAIRAVAGRGADRGS